MKVCPNCGCKEGWLSGREIEKRYGITVIAVPLDTYMSLICICGHHAKYHKNEGSGGLCTKCGGPVHNFIPREYCVVRT